MGVLTVRALDDALIKELRIRAARHGRSAEAEHRLILEEALRPAGSRSKALPAAADRASRDGTSPTRPTSSAGSATRHRLDDDARRRR
jgi:plasmid stability protein